MRTTSAARALASAVALAPLLLPFAAPPARAADEPESPICEEPDCSFLTSSPWTQGPGIPQLIWQTQLGVNHEILDDGRHARRSLDTTIRLEMGLIDRLELDATAGYSLSWETAEAQPLEATDGAVDTILGLRYRVLTQEDHWLTLTAGPLLTLPTGQPDRGTGLSDKAGYGADVSASHDFGRVFFYASWTWYTLPDVNDPTPGTTREFDLHSMTWAGALAWKALEDLQADGYHHDVHVYVELAATHDRAIAQDASGRSFADRTESFVLAPGARYGFKTPKDRLFEFGISVPIGLDRDADDWGVIFLFQYEFPMGNADDKG